MLNRIRLNIIPKGKRKRNSKEKVSKLLDTVGLGSKKMQKPSQLSYEEQQRVAIVRALAKDPLLVLADKPTGNLDIETTRKIMNLMREINKKQRVTFIISTYDPVVAKMADRVIVLRDGKIVEMVER